MIKSIIILLASFISSPSEVNSNSCDNLIHLGDSTSLNIQPELKDQYSKGPYNNIIIDVSNGRSIYYDSRINGLTGLEAVKNFKKTISGSICWVVALGTNDASATRS
jgi:hypothetical protein